jgi:hypothetical protein
MFLDEDFYDLIKSGSFHKYVKRTGAPGNYKYWYKLPDGRIVAADDPAAAEHGISHDRAQKEHIMRLMLGKHRGHHSMTEKQMGEHIGVPKETVHYVAQNFRNRGLRTGNHGFEDHHAQEAHQPEWHGHTGESTTSREPAAPTPEPTPAPAAPTPAPAPEPESSISLNPSRDEAIGERDVQSLELQRFRLISDARAMRKVQLPNGEYEYHVAIRQQGGKWYFAVYDRPPSEGGLLKAPIKETGDEVYGAGLSVAIKNSRGREFNNHFRDKEGWMPRFEHEHSMDRQLEDARKLIEIEKELNRSGFAIVRSLNNSDFQFEKSNDTFIIRISIDRHHEIEMEVYDKTSRRKSKISAFEFDRDNRIAEFRNQSLSAIAHKMISRANNKLEGRRFDGSAYRPTEPAPASAPAPAPVAPAMSEQEQEIQRLREQLRAMAPELHDSMYAQPTQEEQEAASQAQQRAREAKERARAASSPTSPAAAEIHEADPALREADEPIARMEEAQRRGENPYFARAKEIYNNIRADLKPERREKVGHLLNAIEQLEGSGTVLSEANILAKYKQLTGSSRISTLPVDDFERATFMTLDEVMTNAPLDPEVERMKRGYAAKQFTRLRPYLKEEWTRSNPSAPPPMPTFGDIKTWTEHGGPKPEWAGTTRTAVPREVFDGAAKGPDGKPKYPPSWMPIHMMPMWNYIVKKAGAEIDNRQSGPYQTQNPVRADQTSPTGFRLDTGNQARYQEGMAINAIRKYVKMRGGADQLTDIPKTKLAEVGLTHADIFKADVDSDEGLKQVIRHKIIDPVALLPFIKEEMNSNISKSVKKSFSLVVDKSLAPVSFKKDIELKKSQIIKKIKALKARG